MVSSEKALTCPVDAGRVADECVHGAPSFQISTTVEIMLIFQNSVSNIGVHIRIQVPGFDGCLLKR